MAKKDKDAAYNEFLADIKAIVGDDKWSAVEEALIKNDKASAKLRDGVLARAEFSSQMDALKAEREAFAAEVAEARSRIGGWQKWYGDVVTEIKAREDKLKAYMEAYGELDSPERTRGAQQAGYSKEEFEKRLSEELQQRDLANLKFADDLTEIKLDYRERFKGKLDTGAVYKIAGENGLPLDAAYNLYIADKVEEQRQASFDEAVKKARQEGAAEALAKHNLPVVPSNPAHVHTLDAKDIPASSKDRIAAAVANFRELASQR